MCEGGVEATGVLYDLHTGYPGAKFKKDGSPLKGELYYYDDMLSFIEAMENYDLLEGYSPAKHSNNLFNRRVVTVKDSKGCAVEAYAYEVADLRTFKSASVLLNGEWTLTIDKAYRDAIEKMQKEKLGGATSGRM